MKREIVCQVQIAGSAEAVWAVLVDFARYPEWNPFMRRIRGEARAGERIDVQVQWPGGRRLRFGAHIVEAEPGRVLCWRGGVPGLFHGEHRFAIAPGPGGGVVLAQRETFQGLLTPFLWPVFGRKTRGGFMIMNAALKGVVENYGR